MAQYYGATWPVGVNTGVGQAVNLANYTSQAGMNQAAQSGNPFAGWGEAYWGGQAGVGNPSNGGGGHAVGTAVSPYDVPGQYQKAYEEAKAANEQRYQDILTGYQTRGQNLMQAQLGNQADVLSGYENRYQRGMNNLQGLGTQEKKDVNSNYDKVRTQNYQDLVNRGLTASTIPGTMNMGVERERQDALSRVNERLQREALGYDASLSGDALSAQERQYGRTQDVYGQATGDTLQFAERRNDTYPDFNQLAGLMQAYGQGGGMAAFYQALQPQIGDYQLPNMVNGQLQWGGGYMPQGGMGPNDMQQWNAMNPLQKLQFMDMYQRIVQRNQGGMGQAPQTEFQGNQNSNSSSGWTTTQGGYKTPVPARGGWFADLPTNDPIPADGGWFADAPVAVLPPGAEAGFTQDEFAQYANAYGQGTAELAAKITQALGYYPQNHQDIARGLQALGIGTPQPSDRPHAMPSYQDPFPFDYSAPKPASNAGPANFEVQNAARLLNENPVSFQAEMEHVLGYVPQTRQDIERGMELRQQFREASAFFQ